MSHKRQVTTNKKNTIPRRVQQSNPTARPAPKVTVKANNGSEPEDSRLGAKIKAPRSALPSNPKPAEPIIPIKYKRVPAPRSGPSEPNVTQLEAKMSQCNLAAPQYNTTVRRHEEINTLKQMRAVVTEENITPRSKDYITPKISQKLNFRHDDIVFSDMLNLNVNDSLLVPQKKRQANAKSRSSSAPKKPGLVEPQLEDYLEPIEPIELPLPEEPELLLDFPDEPFDFLQAYKDVYCPKM